MRNEIYIDAYNTPTPGEPWKRTDEWHWYNASTEFAREHLTEGGTCLVIGSPLQEVLALRLNGWDVTYLDIRTPPASFGKHICCDAMNMPEMSFDAVSSTCVLCHAGTGRYGDAIDINGDQRVLRGIARVLRPGGKAAITFGCVADIPNMIRIGMLHRIYNITEVKRMILDAGLTLKDSRIWGWRTKGWVDNPQKPEQVNDTWQLELGQMDYISTFCTKDVAAGNP